MEKCLPIRQYRKVIICTLILATLKLILYMLSRDAANIISDSISVKYIDLPNTTVTLAATLPGCGCVRMQHGDPDVTSNSTCAGFAGAPSSSGQLVVSFSFFGAARGRYLDGIERNTARVRELYPGWRVRLYVNGRVWRRDEQLQSLRCQLMCRYDYLDFCDVTQVPGLGDVSKKFGMVWRFLPLGDDSVERFIVRDLDAPLHQREVDAVNQWITSGLKCHVMRDHPNHVAVILGGMWGCWNNNNNNTYYGGIARRMVQEATYLAKGEDQKLLGQWLWPPLYRSRQLLSHDSYLCRVFPRTRPFPSRRQSAYEIVGADATNRLTRKCPRQCRPRNHTDWEMC